MRRREFIGLLGGAAAAWPLPVRAQPTQKVARIAVIGPSAESPVNAAQYELLKAELGKLGFGAGDLTIDIHPVDDPRGQPFVAAAD